MENKKTGKAWRAEQIARRDEMVEYVRKLINDGYSTKDIASKLCVSESTAKSLKKIIGDAEKKQ